MKTKSQWMLGLLALVAVATLLAVRSCTPGTISARVVGHTTDASGELHIVYKIANGTSSRIEFLAGRPRLEAHHDRTGWWEVSDWTTVWHTGSSNGVAQSPRQVILGPRAVIQCELISSRFGREGSAIRGKLGYIKVETQTMKALRSFASHLHLPSRWLMFPKPALLSLPDADFAVVTKLAGGAPASTGTALPAKSGPPAAAQPAEEILPAGSIKFRNVDLRVVLDIYADLAHAQLEIDAPVRAVNAKITLETTEPLPRSELLHLFEKTLQDQAGLVLRPLDGNHVSVKMMRP